MGVIIVYILLIISINIVLIILSFKFGDKILDIIDHIIKKVRKNEIFRWIILFPFSLAVYVFLIYINLSIVAGLILLVIGYNIAPNSRNAIVNILAIISVLLVPILPLLGIGIWETTYKLDIFSTLVPIPSTFIGLYILRYGLDSKLALKFSKLFTYDMQNLRHNDDKLKYYYPIFKLIHENKELINQKFSNRKLENLKKEFIESAYHLEYCLSLNLSKNYDDKNNVTNFTRIKTNHAKSHMWKQYHTFIDKAKEINPNIK